MLWVQVRFYAELNDHLPPEKQYRRYPIALPTSRQVAEVIEEEGIPLAEVELALVNGLSVGSEHLLCDGDCLSAYPVFEALDVSPLVRFRSRPLRQVKFVLDVHLGKLASLLRMLGFDTLYTNTYTDGQLLSFSLKEARILLSRDRQLIAREELMRSHLISHEQPLRQLEEVVERFDLTGSFAPFTRCLLCNAPLVPVEKGDIEGRVPARVLGSFQKFSLCPACGRVYWEGSHHSKMLAIVNRLRTEAGAKTSINARKAGRP